MTFVTTAAPFPMLGCLGSPPGIVSLVKRLIIILGSGLATAVQFYHLPRGGPLDAGQLNVFHDETGT